MAKKKATAKTKCRTEGEVLMIDALNKAEDLTDTILECGSAMANECHDVYAAIYKVAAHYKFERKYPGSHKYG